MSGLITVQYARAATQEKTRQVLDLIRRVAAHAHNGGGGGDQIRATQSELRRAMTTETPDD